MGRPDHEDRRGPGRVDGRRAPGRRNGPVGARQRSPRLEGSEVRRLGGELLSERDVFGDGVGAGWSRQLTAVLDSSMFSSDPFGWNPA